MVAAQRHAPTIYFECSHQSHVTKCAHELCVVLNFARHNQNERSGWTNFGEFLQKVKQEHNLTVLNPEETAKRLQPAEVGFATLSSVASIDMADLIAAGVPISNAKMLPVVSQCCATCI